MRKSLVVFTAALLLASGGMALSLDSIIDLSCTASMAASFNPLCVPVTYDDIIEGSPEDTRAELVTKNTIVADGREQITTELSSNLNQSFGIGMAEAKIQAITALNNGSTKSKAKTVAGSEIDDFYAAQQRRLLNYRNREVIKLNESVNSVKSTSGLDLETATKRDICISGSNDNEVDFETTSGNVTLVNGSTMSVYGARWVDDAPTTSGSTCFSQNDDVFQPADGANFTTAIIPISPSKDGFAMGFEDASGNTVEAAEHTPYSNVWSEQTNQRQQAYNNALGIVDNVYAAYQSGAVETSELIGPLEALKTASTNYDSTGYYAYKAYSLEQAGIPTAESYGFKVRFDVANTTKTRWGQLFASKGQFSNDTLEVNKTYDGSDKYVEFVHSTPSGSAVTTSLDSNFTILEMENTETGESVNSTELQSIQFHTDGTNDLAEQLDEIKENQQDLLTSSGGGAGGSGGWSLPFGLGTLQIPTTKQMGIAAGVIVVIALLFGA